MKARLFSRTNLQLQSTQIEGQGGDHREDDLAQDRFILLRLARMLPLNGRRHGCDVSDRAIKHQAMLQDVPRKT